jgi:hypothetical protein
MSLAKTNKSHRSRLTQLKLDAERAYSHALASGFPREAAIFKNAAEELILRDNPAFFEAIGRMRRTPVTIDEFVESKEFLAGVEYDIWPTLREELRMMNPDVLIGEQPIHLNLLGGATGWGKSHLSTGTLAYQTYLLTCYEQPQRLFGLTPMTTIVGMLQSVSPTITKRVLYQPFRKMFTGMRYTQKWVGWNDKLESLLELEGNIQIVPTAASLQSLLGQAVFAAILDEVNFMAIIEDSKQVPGAQGMGGYYDQAEEVFSNIERRRQRSFTTKGVSIGSISAVSSTRYKNDFLDRKIDEMERIYEEERHGANPIPKNFITLRYSQFAKNPRFADGGYATFDLLVGTDEYGSRVLEDWEKPGVHFPADATIYKVPMPYKVQFKKNPDAALRDVIGISTDAITPFFRRKNKITDAIQRGEERGLKPWVKQDEWVLAEDDFPEWIIDNLPGERVRDRPHFAHVDLSKNKDRCGIGIVRHDGWINQESDVEPGTFEVLPKLTVVAAIGIQPDVMNEIDIARVRQFVLSLTRHGVNLQSLTFDGFGSAESIQITRKFGVHSDVVSVDRGTAPYEAARDILYQDRLDIQPGCELLKYEWQTVEHFPIKNKVDHPPRGTKDVSDGVVGAINEALTSRLIRTGMETTDSDGNRQRTPPASRRKQQVRRKAVIRRR